MIDYKSFGELNLESTEGKLLLASLAILTSLDHKHIESKQVGSMAHPDDVFDKIVTLANKMYFAEEYKTFLQMQKRDEKINTIIDED